MFEGIESRIRVICGGVNLNAIETRLSQLFGWSRGSAEIQPQSPTLAQKTEMLQLWTQLLHLRADYESGTSVCLPTTASGVAQLFQEGKLEDETPDNREPLLQSMAHYITQKPHPSAVIRHGTPLFADIGYFISHDDPNCNGLRCTYSLQLFLRSYQQRTLVTKLDSVLPTNGRLRALKFAQEILPSLGSVLGDKSMPCRCYRTLAFHLEGLQGELRSFLEEVDFGLFVKSPWVSGAHILEMLETTFYYGLRLLSYRNYVGSVLHTYNILKIFGDLESVPVLEQLCNTFNEVVFPGGRPSRNFKACWVRFIGGRLRFDSHESQHRTGNHQFVIPPHKAKTTAGFGLRKEANDERFAYRRISLFHHIKERNYHLDEDLWTQVYQGHGKSHSPCSLPRHQDSLRPSCHSQHRLLHLHSKALSEFSSEGLPSVKINFFDIYMHCVQIISVITDHMHEKGDDRCTCFLETLVLAADRFQDRKHRNEPFGYKGLLEACKNAVRQVLGEKNCQDFFWKNL